MNSISNFSLYPLLDRRWGTCLSSDVLFNGSATGLRVEGSVLAGQFEVERGYLLLTEYEPPFDQSLKVYMASKGFEILDVRKVSFIMQYGKVSDVGVVDGKLRFSYGLGRVWEVEVLRSPKLMIYRRAPADVQAFDKDPDSRWFARRHVELRLVQWK